jgi:signal transduction histidine kinase
VVIEFLLLATAILVVGIVLRRLRQVEYQRDTLMREMFRDEERDPEQEAFGAANMLIGELCHMVISPLTVILGQCELARAQGGRDKRIETVERQARRIADVIERHRGFAPAQRSEIREIDPAAVARAAVAAVTPAAAERHVRIHEMFDEPPPIRANAFLLGHALRHLLRAGVEAAPKGMGDVTLAVGVLPVDGDPAHVAFAVADDGPGIEPERLPHVFHPFPAEQASWRGAALSYAIVYAIARAMGADLLVESAPGAGTRATLKVPLSRPADVPEVKADAPAVAAGA